MPPDTLPTESLYDRDILAWTEAQVAALRALAGRRDLPNTLDLDNVIEEIESVGRSQLDATASPIRLILEHLIKLHAQPNSLSATHWRAEIANWHDEFLQRFAPSMRQKIDLDRLWRAAKRIAARRAVGHFGALPKLGDRCPLPLDAFLPEEFDFDDALARIAAAAR